MGRKACKSLLVLLFVFALGGVALDQYRRVEHARQAVLEEDRRVVQDAIRSYSEDLGEPPQTLQDLVDAGYLKATPDALAPILLDAPDSQPLSPAK